MGEYRYKETEYVAHIDCLEHKMRVERFVREKKEVIISTEPLQKKEKMFLIAIECSWYEGKVLKKHKFNSRVLVPWHVAISGLDVASVWLKDNFKR